MSAADWAALVSGYAAEHDLAYQPVGGLNPRDAPPALCVGGSNRLTGKLAEEFWGSSCDADEREEGGLFRKTVVPAAVLVKAHMPDLAEVVSAFNVESLERNPEELLRKRIARRVEFESLEFNRRFLATVPSEYDPVALRELFGPGFLDWVTRIHNEIDFGVSDRQLWFLWRLRARTEAELEEALENAGELFRRIRSEMEEHGRNTYPAGPWHAGLEPFPSV